MASSHSEACWWAIIKKVWRALRILRGAKYEAIRAARTLKKRARNDVVFLLVGDGAARGRLEETARAQGLENVIFTGRQSKETIPAFLSVSDCCLVHLRKTDLFESVLPSKIAEAGAAERPVILGVAGHAARLLQASGGGVCIEPENDGELVDAVERLRGDTGLCARLGRAGREYVLEHFDGDRLAADYLELIDRVCGRTLVVHPQRAAADG